MATRDIHPATDLTVPVIESFGTASLKWTHATLAWAVEKLRQNKAATVAELLAYDIRTLEEEIAAREYLERMQLRLALGERTDTPIRATA